MTLEQTNRGTAAAAGFIIGGIIFAVLTTGVILSAKAPAINADRAEARSKALAEIHAAEQAALNISAVIDAQRGIVRLPIETAMLLTAKQWQNPAAARADLNSRVEKASAPAPTQTFE
jgi:hypothetical protein